MPRHKDANWNLPDPCDYSIAALAVLMDIRDELQTANSTLLSINGTLRSTFLCGNTIGIPHTLKRIDRRIAKHLPLKAKPRA